MMNASPQLRAMSVGEILDKAFRMYRARFGTYLAIAAIPLLPVTVFALLAAGNELAASCLNLLDSIAQYLATLALVYAIGQNYLAKPCGIKEAFSNGSGRFWTYFGANFIIGLAFGASVIPLFFLELGCGGIFLYLYLVLLIPLILFLSTRWTLVGVSVVLEKTGATESLSRSWELTGDYFWHALGLTLASGVLVILISVIPQLAVTYILEYFVSTTASVLASNLGSQFATIIFLPFSVGVQVLLYYDLRIRKENFDLEYTVTELDKEIQEQTFPNDTRQSSLNWSDDSREEASPNDEDWQKWQEKV